MGRKTSILLLTNFFPFGTGEQFLETELQVLEDMPFEGWLLPIFLKKIPQSPMRKIPNNFQISPVVNQLCQFGFSFYLKSLCKINLIEFLSSFPKSKSRLNVKFVLLLLKHWLESEYVVNQICLLHDVSKINVVYSYWFNQGAMISAKLKRLFPSLTCICRSHGIDLYSEQMNLRELPCHFYSLRYIDKVIPCSKYGEEYLKLKYEMYKEKISYNYLGVKSQNITIKSFNKNFFFLISCSYVDYIKRIDLIAKALKMCRETIHWVHIGDGPNMKELYSLVKSFPNNITARFIGSIPNVKVLQYYAENEIDFFINVSSWEGIPVSIMEAMSFGIPCIATSICGVPEIVDDSCGMLIHESITDVQLSVILDKIAANKHSFIHIKDKAKRKQVEKFDCDKNYKAFYTSILKL